jgi:hypothetical protein
MAALTWTDAVGTATLRSRFPAPADRFASWTPLTRPVGDARVAPATGALHRFTFRTDYAATFELRGISAHKTGGVFPLELANRLRAHLLGGGTVSVATEDNATSTYPTCGLLDGAEPQLALADPGALDYTLSVALVNLAGVPVAMVCRYGAV